MDHLGWRVCFRFSHTSQRHFSKKREKEQEETFPPLLPTLSFSTSGLLSTFVWSWVRYWSLPFSVDISLDMDIWITELWWRAWPYTPPTYPGSRAHRWKDISKRRGQKEYQSIMQPCIIQGWSADHASPSKNSFCKHHKSSKQKRKSVIFHTVRRIRRKVLQGAFSQCHVEWKCHVSFVLVLEEGLSHKSTSSSLCSPQALLSH